MPTTDDFIQAMMEARRMHPCPKRLNSFIFARHSSRFPG